MSVPIIISNNVPLHRPQPYRPTVNTLPHQLPPPPPPVISRRQQQQLQQPKLKPAPKSDNGLSDRACAHPSFSYNISFPRITSGSAVTTLSGGTSPSGSQATLRQMSMPRTIDGSLVSTPTLPTSSDYWSSRDEPNNQLSKQPTLSSAKYDQQASRLSRIQSRSRLASMRRVMSHNAIRRQRSENNSEPQCEAVAAARRTATAVQNDWTKRPTCFVKDDHDDNEIVLQGFCRMPRFAKLRKTRFLRLARRQLECFDARLRKLVWSVVLDGARVRIQTKQHKITLSKLQCGYLIEFFVYDEQSCKDWAAALLRASMLASLQQR